MGKSSLCFGCRAGQRSSELTRSSVSTYSNPCEFLGQSAVAASWFRSFAVESPAPYYWTAEFDGVCVGSRSEASRNHQDDSAGHLGAK